MSIFKNNFILIGFSEFFAKAISWLSLAIIPFFASPEIYGQVILYYSIIIFLIPIYLFGQDRLILKTNEPKQELINSLVFSILIWLILAIIFYYFNYFLASITGLILALNKIYLTYFRSKENLKSYALNRVVYSIFRFWAIFCVVYFFYSLNNYIISEFLAALVVTFGLFVLFFKTKLKINFVFIERIKHGLPLMLHGLSLFGVALVDRFILKKYTDLSVVGNYSFIYIFASGLIFLYSIISILQEKKIYISKNNTELILNVKKTFFMMVLIGAVGCVGSIFIYYLIFKFNLIKDYTYYFNELVILLLAHLILPFYLISNYILIQSNKSKYLLGCSLFALLINVVSNLILIPNYGLQGAVYATLISNIILVAISLIICSKVVGIKERS